MILLPSAQVQFLVGELTYHQLPGMAKKPKKTPKQKPNNNTKKNPKKQEAFLKVMLYANFRLFSFFGVFDVIETRKNLGPGHLVLVLALLLTTSMTLTKT